MEHNIIPPTINVDNLDPATEGLDIVINKAKEREVNYVMSDTFGFGGHNTIVIWFSKVGDYSFHDTRKD